MQHQVQDGWRQLQREKEELQQKVGDLQDRLKKLQGERTEAERKLARLSKERLALRKALEKVKLLLKFHNKHVNQKMPSSKILISFK